MEAYEYLPSQKKNREIGKRYSYFNRIVIWNGKQLRCIHDKYISNCIICNKNAGCEHNKLKKLVSNVILIKYANI